MYEFYHHEDEVGQEQLLPIEWWDYCRGELEAIEEHTKAHLDPSGAGWTEMYTFKEADSALPKLNMSEARFHELLAPFAKRFDCVTNPLSEFDATHGIRSIGYGPTSSSAGLVADLQHDKLCAILGPTSCPQLSRGRPADEYVDGALH